MSALLLLGLVLLGQSGEAAPASTDVPAPEAARSALEAELTEGTYTLQRDERSRGDLARALFMRALRGIAPILNWLSDRVKGGLGSLGLNLGVVEVLVQVALILAGVALVAAIVYWILRRVRARREEVLDSAVRLSAVSTSSDSELLSLTARRALRRAQQAFDDADNRLALRYAFWALLLALAEEGHYKVQAGRTNREYERLLPRQSEGRSLLSRAIGVFERCWYGRQEATPAQYNELIDQVRPLIEAPRGRT